MRTGDVTVLSLSLIVPSQAFGLTLPVIVHVLLCIDVYVHTVTYSVQYSYMYISTFDERSSTVKS